MAARQGEPSRGFLGGPMRFRVPQNRPKARQKGTGCMLAYCHLRIKRAKHERQ